MNRAADKDRRFNFETRNVKLEIRISRSKRRESRVRSQESRIKNHDFIFFSLGSILSLKVKYIASVRVFTNRNSMLCRFFTLAPRLVSSPTEISEIAASVWVRTNQNILSLISSLRFLSTHPKNLKIVLIFILAGLFSCKSNSLEKKNTQTVIDGTGRVVQISRSPQTVMALSPSMTELLFELVSPECIVGRTDQCDYPAACLSLPKVQVYPSVNLEKVLKINPDIIISNSEITPPETAEKLTQLGIPVLLYEINSIQKLHTTIREVSKLLDTKVKGEALIKEGELQIRNYKSDSLVIPKSSLSAVTLISIDPIYVYGTTSFFNELLEIAGFENAIDSSLGSYPQVSRSMLLKLNPDYLLGYDFEALDTTFFELYPELRSMKAYQQKNIYPLDGDLAARPSPRFVELIKEMRKIIKREGLK